MGPTTTSKPNSEVAMHIEHALERYITQLRANGRSDPDWGEFRRRYRLDALPFPPAPQEVFAFGERGWLHAAGWLGDRHGNVLRLGSAAAEPAAFDHARALTLRLLGAGG